MAVTISKPIYCRNCGLPLTWQEQMTPAWFADICDPCALATIAELSRLHKEADTLSNRLSHDLTYAEFLGRGAHMAEDWRETH